MGMLSPERRVLATGTMSCSALPRLRVSAMSNSAPENAFLARWPALLATAAPRQPRVSQQMADSGDGIEEFREQDRYLPIANVARIMKQGLPPNAKIAKDAKETVQECASEFITFVTSEYPGHGPARRGGRPCPDGLPLAAPCQGPSLPLLPPSTASDKCSAEKRKTINGDDILWAMGTLGFDKYVDPLRLYLQKYREVRAPAAPAGLRPARYRRPAACSRGDERGGGRCSVPPRKFRDGHPRRRSRQSVKGAGDRRRRDDMGMPHAHMGYPAVRCL